MPKGMHIRTLKIRSYTLLYINLISDCHEKEQV